MPVSIRVTDIHKWVSKGCSQRAEVVECKKCGFAFNARCKRSLIIPICPECQKENKKEKTEIEKIRDERRREYQRVRYRQKQALFGTGQNGATADFYMIPNIYSIKDLEKLKNLPYKEFLNTDYWKVVSRYVKYRKKSCQLCDNKFNLNVHHISYRNHGEEHLFWRDDLIVLCGKCHSKHHNKLYKGEN